MRERLKDSLRDPELLPEINKNSASPENHLQIHKIEILTGELKRVRVQYLRALRRNSAGNDTATEKAKYNVPNDISVQSEDAKQARNLCKTRPEAEVYLRDTYDEMVEEIHESRGLLVFKAE
jgi:hypothetical protein